MNKFIDYPYHRTYNYQVEKLLNTEQEIQSAFVCHDWAEQKEGSYKHTAEPDDKMFVFHEEAVLEV